jgi:hypothetical protein
MFRKTLSRFGGGDKTAFASARRVIIPIAPDPVAHGPLLRHSFTTDPLQESRKPTFHTSGKLKDETVRVPLRLEGARSRAVIESMGDKEFSDLVDFIQGATYDQMITGRRFKKVYESMTDNDHVFVWLCMVAMAVLNPGDVRSRLMYRHLEALATAVVNGELSTRTAFRFYETAVRSPAYREVAKRQLNSGAATRLPGICAAAEVMKNIGGTRRPLTSYYQLFQRITERSEALTPWGFPPLFQFEEQMQLEQRLRFFARKDGDTLENRRRKKSLVAHYKVYKNRIFWVPPTWVSNTKWAGPWYQKNPGVMPD